MQGIVPCIYLFAFFRKVQRFPSNCANQIGFKEQHIVLFRILLKKDAIFAIGLDQYLRMLLLKLFDLSWGNLSQAVFALDIAVQTAVVLNFRTAENTFRAFQSFSFNQAKGASAKNRRIQIYTNGTAFENAVAVLSKGNFRKVVDIAPDRTFLWIGMRRKVADAPGIIDLLL
jgi:hypothetical protein